MESLSKNNVYDLVTNKSHQQQSQSQSRQQQQQLTMSHQKQQPQPKQSKKSSLNDMSFNEQSQNGFHSEANSKNSQNNMPNIEFAKTIRLLRNGDAFYKGQKFVINSRKYRYFDVLMDDISNGLNFGAIRKIHTPNNGHRVTDLDQLEDGKTYVAAGNSKFIKLNYHVISEGKRIPPSRLPALTRMDYNNIHVNQYEEPQNATIYIYRNGDAGTPAFKILLYKSTMVSMDAILNEISNKVKLQTGAITKMFTLDGEPVINTNQILNGKCYVVSNREQKFKKIKYLNQDELFNTPKVIKKPLKELPPVKTTFSNHQSQQEQDKFLENSIYGFQSKNDFNQDSKIFLNKPISLIKKVKEKENDMERSLNQSVQSDKSRLMKSYREHNEKEKEDEDEDEEKD